MTLAPASIDDLRQMVTSHPRVRLRGGGTKPGLSSPAMAAGLQARTVDDAVVLELSRLSGIVEHTPQECTFTALAATRIDDIERVLAPHGQYLPFDPPLAEAGATIGGTVAAGVNGSCRYRYGGIRDFLIGARVVDGRGRLIASGGKVVKNAAGFLVHQAMVGSAGRLGVLVELTFKVFPRAEAFATVRADAADLAGALRVLSLVQARGFELEAADIEAPSTVWLRLGGFASAMPRRLDAIQGALGVASDRLEGEADAAEWRRAREFSWMASDAALVRVPTTVAQLEELERRLSETSVRRRYTIAGNLALISWPSSLDELSSMLDTLGMKGQVLIGQAGRAFIGRIPMSEFERRVHSVMDPEGRFGGPV
jgi:glycolate oxidase FAD binding subunit